ncbi:Cytochrome P450 - like 10 [Theobroma cacao]|nr:Cytochrome P450 - like 10 [Theobroma cacao]
MEFSIQLQEQIIFRLLFATVIFIFGAIARVKGNKKQQKRPPELGRCLNQLIHRKLGSLADEYGPAYLISLGIHRALVVSGWEVIKECFTTYDKVFPTRPRTLAAKLMGYDHALMGSAPYGPYWRHTRKIATVELLSNRRLDLLKHVREAEINNLLKELYEESVKSGGVAVCK